MYKKIIALSLLLSLVGCVGYEGEASAACAALPTDRGQAAATVSVPSTGSYRIWSRLYAPNTTNNSYLMQIDQSTCGVVVGDVAIPVGTYTWVDYRSGSTSNKITVSLTAGNHTFLLAGREDNVQLDKIMLLADTSCVPTGLGTNCTSASSGGGTPTGGGRGTSSGGGTTTPSTGQPSSGATGSSTSSSSSSTPSASNSNPEPPRVDAPTPIVAVSDKINKQISIPIPTRKTAFYVPVGVLAAFILVVGIAAGVWWTYKDKFKIPERINFLNRFSHHPVAPIEVVHDGAPAHPFTAQPGTVVNPDSPDHTLKG